MNSIIYSESSPITAEQFISLLRRSSLALRRPVDQPDIIEAMLKHGNLICTAWHENELIGVARSVTDFQYCCYLSDLAIDENYQKMGIGKKLIERTRSQLGPQATIILLAAPLAEGYYPKIGFQLHRSAWTLPPSQNLL